MTLFIVSLVPAMAESGNDDSSSDDDKSETRVEVKDDETRVEVRDEDTRIKVRERDGETEVRVKNGDFERRIRERIQNGKEEIREEVRERVKDGLDKAEHRVRERVREEVDETKDHVRKRMRELIEHKIDSTEDRFEYRTKFEEHKKELRGHEKYEFLKEHRVKAKESYLEHRTKLRSLKEKAKSCTGAECTEKRVELKKGVRLHLLKTADLIERSLEKLTDRLEKADVEGKDEALATIKELEERLETEQARVESLVDDASAAEIREAIKDLKKLWQDTRKAQKKVVALLMRNKASDLVGKYDSMQENMQKRIERLSLTDTSELEALAEKYDAQLVIVKEAEQAVKDAHDTFDDDTEAFKQAQQTLRQEAAALKEILREFTSKFNELK